MAGIDIDFSQLKPTNFAGDYANAFRLGRTLAAPPGQEGSPPAASGAPANAFAASPAAAAPPAAPADPAAAIAAMNDAQRWAAGRRADMLANLLSGLRAASADPAQRLAMARHVASRNPGLGIAPAAIGLADVTDQGLAAHGASIAAVSRMLTEAGQASASAPADDSAEG